MLADTVVCPNETLTGSYRRDVDANHVSIHDFMQLVCSWYVIIIIKVLIYFTCFFLTNITIFLFRCISCCHHLTVVNIGDSANNNSVLLPIVALSKIRFRPAALGCGISISAASNGE